ncbi:MAG TPA: hypothetical protein VIM19_01675 [Actinomycetes bacterium]
MGVVASLLLVIIGALLHVAAPATVPGLDLTLVSTFLFAVGAAGLVLPRLPIRTRRGTHAVGRSLHDDRS